MKNKKKEENISVEDKYEKREKKGIVKKGGKIPILFLIIIIVIIAVIFIFPSKKGKIKIEVKTTLEKIVEKSDLETVNITYNIIAKECSDSNNCDKTSNKINDFKYVVSCKGTITAGIDFKDVEIKVDEKTKKVLVTVPDATIKGEPNIGSITFLSDNGLDASELTNARKLCQETTKEKSNADGKLLDAAKDQARVVLEEFYKQWIKSYDSSYVVEVR